MSEFEAFRKIGRLSREIVVTEKIDGTNGIVRIGEDGSFEVGSRTQWITPERDNHGFAGWAYFHKDELIAGLGVGTHFGEWWGQGIQRKYGLTEKRWSLFNVGRWADWRWPECPLEPKQQRAPVCCHVVPVITVGVGLECVPKAVEMLRASGSIAAPGFHNPEGVVAFHTAARTLFKVTLERDSEPKNRREG